MSTTRQRGPDGRFVKSSIPETDAAEPRPTFETVSARVRETKADRAVTFNDNPGILDDSDQSDDVRILVGVSLVVVLLLALVSLFVKVG
jgi:hypothetical protein